MGDSVDDSVSDSERKKDGNEKEMLDRYVTYFKTNKPDYDEEITAENIVYVFYEDTFGKVHRHIKTQLKQWSEELSKSLVLEALHRSREANNPMIYATTIINNWKEAGVKTMKDVMKLDDAFDF